MTRSDDSKEAQIGIAMSVALHVVLFFLLAWMMGLDHAAQSLLHKARQAAEEPKVTLLFPDQVLPTPKLKPKLEEKQYIRTTQNEAKEDKPAKSDFISDRNTKAASKEAPFPDATAPMPTLKGGDVPSLELTNRNVRDGEIADDQASPETLPVPTPPSAPAMLTPLVPNEPTALPVPLQEIAKTQPSPMAQVMEQMDKADVALSTSPKLPLEVRKPEAAQQGASAPPEPPATPPASAPARVKPPALESFSPFTETARTKGTISNRGEAAVDAEATPMGKFMRAVTSAVEKKWHLLRLNHADAVSYGYLKVQFFVNREGRPEDIKFIEKANNPRMEDFTLEAILKADIPKIPRDLLPVLDGERFPVEYDIIIHD